MNVPTIQMRKLRQRLVNLPEVIWLVEVELVFSPSLAMVPLKG